MKSLPIQLLSFLLVAPLAFADSKEDWDTLKSNAALPARIQAAKLIAERAKKDKECGKIVGEFIEIAQKFATPPELKTALSDAVSSCDSEETAKALIAHVGKGQKTDRLWIVRTSRGIQSADLDKALMQKTLTDEEPTIREQTVDILVAHKYRPAIPQFEAILKAGKDTELLGPLVGGISSMVEGSPDWLDWETRLIEHAKSKVDPVRRGALAALAKQKNVAHLDVFIAALSHPDWSTRALAVDYLQKSNSKKAVGAIIEQLRDEPPGTRMHAEIVGVLTRLSGVSLGDKADDWATWWKNSEATFEFPKSSGPKTEGRKQPKLDSGTAVAEFYGIQIESKRVCFVIDISGSMKEPTQDASSPGTERIEVAKRELMKIIDELPPASLFNIITFNSDVQAWLDHVGDLPGGLGTGQGAPKAPSTGGGKKDKDKDDKPVSEAAKKKDEEKQKKLDEAMRAEAKKYVTRQAANGGTNIHDALELAFQDPVVDTIFFLTDGQPSAGAEIDPVRIREAVQRWNTTRKIKIHTISIGTDFELTKWIAKDSGGDHKFFE
jgi:hypothetical protein